MTRLKLGLIILAGGIVVTVGTYASAATSASGGTYVVAWGAILYGAYLTIRGLAES